MLKHSSTTHSCAAGGVQFSKLGAVRGPKCIYIFLFIITWHSSGELSPAKNTSYIVMYIESLGFLRGFLGKKKGARSHSPRAGKWELIWPTEEGSTPNYVVPHFVLLI